MSCLHVILGPEVQFYKLASITCSYNLCLDGDVRAYENIKEIKWFSTLNYQHKRLFLVIFHTELAVLVLFVLQIVTSFLQIDVIIVYDWLIAGGAPVGTLPYYNRRESFFGPGNHFGNISQILSLIEYCFNLVLKGIHYGRKGRCTVDLTFKGIL